MPEKVAAAGHSKEQAWRALGMELVPLSPELCSRLQVPKDVNGVAVGGIASDSPASAIGLRPGDVIVSIDQKLATTPEQAASELKQASGKGHVLLLVNRHGTSEFVGLSVESNVVAGSRR